MLVTNYKLIRAEGLGVILKDIESGEYVFAYGPKGQREEICRSHSWRMMRARWIEEGYYEPD